MSSPFTSSNSRVVKTWVAQTHEPSTFVPYSPFGTSVIDAGYGSGGYGDLPYGQGIQTQVTYSTEWTVFTLR